MKELCDGVWTWSAFSAEKNLDFNGFMVADSSGNVLIDPPRMEGEVRERMLQLGAPRTILLTNKDHVRASREFGDLLGARIGIHELDATFLDFKPDFVFRDGVSLPGALLAVHVPDNKSPGETAFLLRRGGGVLILGDALIGEPAGRLRLLPPGKYADAEKARRGLFRLLDHSFDAVLVGDGVCIPSGGRAALQRFLDSP
jgi:glyoxylase-like metal-dependent hydrolase (beta-lactamase superfamily II)